MEFQPILLTHTSHFNPHFKILFMDNTTIHGLILLFTDIHGSIIVRQNMITLFNIILL